MTSMKIVQFSRPSTPIVHLRPKFFHHLDLGRPISNEPPSPNDNQSIKRKRNPSKYGYYVLPGPSFGWTFVFSINSLILSGFPLTSFHSAEASLSAFSWLYTLVCAVVQKYHEMYFLHSNRTRDLLFDLVHK